MPVALTIAQVVEKVLTRFDANSDASISLTELLSVLDPTGTGLDVATKAAALLAEVGGNSDDDVLQKLLHGRGLHGDRTAPTPQSVETIVDGLLTKFDANADQSITLTELLGGLNADDRLHADLTTLLTQIVADLDNNGDGGLSTVSSPPQSMRSTSTRTASSTSPRQARRPQATPTSSSSACRCTTATTCPTTPSEPPAPMGNARLVAPHPSPR
jgi:hypothetical protein